MDKKTIDLLVETEKPSEMFNELFKGMFKNDINPVFSKKKNIKTKNKLEPIENLFDWWVMNIEYLKNHLRQKRGWRWKI